KATIRFTARDRCVALFNEKFSTRSASTFSKAKSAKVRPCSWTSKMAHLNFVKNDGHFHVAPFSLVAEPKAMDLSEFDNCVLYTGLSGVELDFNELDLGAGTSIRRIFALLMMPMIMSFKKPEEGGPEKSFWAAVGGGMPHDIHVELKLSDQCGA